MGRQHAGGPLRDWRRSNSRNAVQDCAQRPRSTRNCRRAKSGYAIFRETLRNPSDRVATVKRVDAFQPVDVYVDEARKHDMAAQIECIRCTRRTHRTHCTHCTNCTRCTHDPFAIEHERAF